LDEEQRGGRKIGTTCQGVGPAYTDKVRRIGIRMGDFVDTGRFPEVLNESLSYNNKLLTKIYGAPALEESQVLAEYGALAARLGPYVRDTAWIVGEAMAADRRVLFEGAQGTLLDIDHGTYPYVTSSHPVAGGACLGTGAGPSSIGAVIGVVKAYTSRVGEGNFPTELSNAIGEGIRERGHEYGTTTGRARRVGWLDAVALRFAMMVNGIDRLAITLLDVLSGMEEIKICKAYRTPAGIVDRLPLRNLDLAECEPVYETFEGWTQDIAGIRRYADLPAAARHYVDGVARLVGQPVWLVSVGPHRDQTVLTGQANQGLWLRWGAAPSRSDPRSEPHTESHAGPRAPCCLSPRECVHESVFGGLQ
ncbi:MAG: adenylosuccinate synthase, partial [Chloroflexi bacterium]|nr:adenylosuccinate synthase [Chloroflexota bacterium]